MFPQYNCHPQDKILQFILFWFLDMTPCAFLNSHTLLSNQRQNSRRHLDDTTCGIFYSPDISWYPDTFKAWFNSKFVAKSVDSLRFCCVESSVEGTGGWRFLDGRMQGLARLLFFPPAFTSVSVTSLMTSPWEV